MAGGKIKGISKKEGVDIKKFEWGQRRGRELFGSLIFFFVLGGCSHKKKAGN